MKQDYEALLNSLLPDPDEAAYHLTKAEMSGYVKRNLDEVTVETAESHLEVCAECMQAVEELRAATSDDSYALPAESVVGKVERGGTKTGIGLMAFFTPLRRPAQFALLTLLILMLVVATIFFTRARKAQPTQANTGHDEKENQNTDNRNALVPNPTPDQPQGTDKNATVGDDVPTPPQSGSEQGRTDSTAESPATGVEKLSPSLQQAITSALSVQRIEKPQVLAELNGKSGTLLSESGDGLPFRLLSPVGKVIQNSRPSFRWNPLTGASSYVVTVVDDNLNVVATSAPLTTTQWSTPTPLKRGGVYSWQVTAYKDGKEIISPVMPAPQVKFKILSQQQNKELEHARRVLPNYHLGLGVLYAQAGLLDEAEREFQAQLKATPRSAVARKLLLSVRSMKN